MVVIQKMKCKNCFKEFDRKPSDIRRGRTKFCSMECSQEYKSSSSKKHAESVLKAGKKQCKMCGKTRLLKFFPKSKKSATGYFSYCINCRRDVNRNSDVKRSKGCKRKDFSRRAYLKRTYAITQEEYDEMWKKQGCKCAICGSSDTTKKLPAIDHCHNTGKIRGILCENCNRGLGMFHDDIGKMQSAIDYLKYHLKFRIL